MMRKDLQVTTILAASLRALHSPLRRLAALTAFHRLATLARLLSVRTVAKTFRLHRPLVPFVVLTAHTDSGKLHCCVSHSGDNLAEDQTATPFRLLPMA